MRGLGDLVGVLMQGGMGNSGMGRLEHAMGNGGIGDVLGQMLGGTAGTGSGGGGLLGNVLGGVLGGSRGASGGMGGLGELAGALFGGASGSRASSMGGGAMAMLAGLALQALMKRGGAQSNAFAGEAMPLGLRAPQSAEEEEALETEAALMLRAMIGAAQADGRIDESEMQRIAGKLGEGGGADQAARDFVMDLMRSPPDFDALVADIADRQTAAQAYAASLFAIEVDTQAERDYLQRLARATGLDEEVTGEIRRSLGMA